MLCCIPGRFCLGQIVRLNFGKKTLGEKEGKKLGFCVFDREHRASDQTWLWPQVVTAVKPKGTGWKRTRVSQVRCEEGFPDGGRSYRSPPHQLCSTEPAGTSRALQSRAGTQELGPQAADSRPSSITKLVYTACCPFASLFPPGIWG